MLSWSFKINILYLGWLWKLKGSSKMQTFQGDKNSDLTTENWKLFSRGRLSVCELEITTLPFFSLFVSIFWPETISKNEII